MLVKYEKQYPRKRINKRALGHLRMTVYKGVGKHSSSQSPAMNCDRSAVSLRLYMDYVDKINRM